MQGISVCIAHAQIPLINAHADVISEDGVLNFAHFAH